MKSLTWKERVADLRDVKTCNFAAHALSDYLPPKEGQPTLLHEALKTVLAAEIIGGTIYAYRDWSSQPYCDLILAEFEADEVLSIFLSIPEPTSNMKMGVLGLMQDVKAKNALVLARMFNNPDESAELISAVRYTLSMAADSFDISPVN